MGDQGTMRTHIYTQGKFKVANPPTDMLLGGERNQRLAWTLGQHEKLNTDSNSGPWSCEVDQWNSEQRYS